MSPAVKIITVELLSPEEEAIANKIDLALGGFLQGWLFTAIIGLSMAMCGSISSLAVPVTSGHPWIDVSLPVAMGVLAAALSRGYFRRCHATLLKDLKGLAQDPRTPAVIKKLQQINVMIDALRGVEGIAYRLKHPVPFAAKYARRFLPRAA